MPFFRDEMTSGALETQEGRPGVRPAEAGLAVVQMWAGMGSRKSMLVP
jgi:hypothetical protein